MLSRPLSHRRPAARAQHGAALMEVLVSIVITGFGLLALAGLQTKMNAAMLESYQRAQALTLLTDMTQRIQSNLNQSTAYVTTDPAGTGDAAPADCTDLGAVSRAERDLCEWSNALKGAAEARDDANVGAMIGARGCVEQLAAANPASGICQPARYRVTVACQGMNATVVPAVGCGADAYGTDDSLRKVLSTRVVIPLPSCS
jgi:type IV pilus assembly protein PilV